LQEILGKLETIKAAPISVRRFRKKEVKTGKQVSIVEENTDDQEVMDAPDFDTLIAKCNLTKT
jgi:hypothetical protein